MGKWTTRTAPSASVGGGFVGQRLRVDVDKHFGDWYIDRGLLLTYLAEQFIDKINERTDSGTSAVGSRFKPYAPLKRAWVFDKATQTWLHDERGRRIARDIPDPRTVVTLRSLQDVPDGKRMRDWLRVQPQRLAPEAKQVRIVQSGGRKIASGEHLSHAARAGRCVDTGRKHIGVLDIEYRAVLNYITRDAVVAFIRRRSERLLAAEVQRARSRLERQRRRTERAAKRAAKSADQRAREARARLDRMGLDPSGDVKAQYKERSRQRRIARRGK